jgi:hypothetical protein
MLSIIVGWTYCPGPGTFSAGAYPWMNLYSLEAKPIFTALFAVLAFLPFFKKLLAAS